MRLCVSPVLTEESDFCHIFVFLAQWMAAAATGNEFLKSLFFLQEMTESGEVYSERLKTEA